MDVDWETTLPTKRELGAGYLAGAGAALALSLLGYVWFTRESLVVLVLSAAIAFVLFVTIIYVGYLFQQNDFSGEYVWDVAQWAAVGLGTTSLLSIGIGVSRAYLTDSALVPSLLVITIATGGVIGTLLGVVAGLRNQHDRMRRISQRNKVMNRVLRHDIKNAMNIVRGKAMILADEAGLRNDPSVAAIERTADEVVSLSEAARKIDSLDARSRETPVDVVRLVEGYLETARERYPGADISTDLPDSAWAGVDSVVRSAVANLVENAVEHHDGSPSVSVDVTRHGGVDGTVTIRVADDGPGIPDQQIDVLFSESEGPTRHGNGLGLWLVKWLVDTYDGRLEIEDNDPRGTVVTLEFPAAQPSDAEPDA